MDGDVVPCEWVLTKMLRRLRSAPHKRVNPEAPALCQG